MGPWKFTKLLYNKEHYHVSEETLSRMGGGEYLDQVYMQQRTSIWNTRRTKKRKKISRVEKINNKKCSVGTKQEALKRSNRNGKKYSFKCSGMRDEGYVNQNYF